MAINEKDLDDMFPSGTVKALRFEEYVWRLRGNSEKRMEKIVDAISIYRDKVTQATCARYFSPAPEIELDGSIGSINELIMVLDRLEIDVYWDQELNDIMYLPYE